MISNPNMMTLSEVLQTINDDVSLLGTTFRYSPNSPLSQVFRFAFVKSEKWVLPEGNPPYTPYMGAIGTSADDLLLVIRRGRFDYFTKYKNVKPIKREELFIKLLEGVHASEAKVLLAVKDQELHKSYPNITYEVLIKYGYLPEDFPEGERVFSKSDLEKHEEEKPETVVEPETVAEESKPKTKRVQKAKKVEVVENETAP